MPKCDFNKLLCNFIEIALQHGCFPVNLLHIFRTPFSKNTSGRLLLLLSDANLVFKSLDRKIVFQESSPNLASNIKQIQAN